VTTRAIVGGTVYTPSRIVRNGVLLIENRRIAEIGARRSVTLPSGTEIVDARGGIICPGMVDIHLHGGDGADCVDGTEQAVRTVARRHLRQGTTSLLPTTATEPLPQIWRSFDAVRKVMSDPHQGEAHVLGVHMEGPFFSVSQRGAHAAELLRMPTPAEERTLFNYLDVVKRVSLAPERAGALSLIERLSAAGVLVSGAHSDALYGQVCEAMAAGMSHITHLWSGMSTVRRIGPKRYSGMLEAGLIEDGLTGEIIADGYHLPSSLIKMAYRLKGAEKLCLVSDAMRASGCGPGEYEVAGQAAIVEPGGGVAITPDHKAFAGSISTVLQCLQHIVLTVGISLQDGLRMATETPARIQGVADRAGRLAPGMPADVLILDPGTLALRATFMGGRLVGGKTGGAGLSAR